MASELENDWTAVFKRPFAVLTDDELVKLHQQLMNINVDKLPERQHKDFLELMRQVLTRGEIKKSASDATNYWTKCTENVISTENDPPIHATGNGGIDETYYIQKIQDLNQKLAQSTYNRHTTEIGDGDSSMYPMGIDTKKDLLSKIHTKNKYIKRLLCENDSLRQQIDQLNEKNIQLDICLKQTTNRLAKANGDLMELKRQNTIGAEDIAVLNNKIRDISQQMCNMEKEKLKYQTDILFLGQEIHKRVDRWNDALRNKRQRMPAEAVCLSDDGADVNELHLRRVPAIKVVDTENDRLEVSILSQAVRKRNAIITELELLLTDLTVEVAHSADVINNLTKNFKIRENNFAENLEKLQGHLSALLYKQKPSSPKSPEKMASASQSPTHVESKQKPKIKRKIRKHKERTI